MAADQRRRKSPRPDYAKRAKYGTAHQRARAAALRAFKPGQLCVRCGLPMTDGQQLDLDHAEPGDGRTYLGLAHARCNKQAGGRKSAALAGFEPRDRRCLVCGVDYTAHMPDTVTCGRQACVTAIRRIRYERKPDPEPPPRQPGWAWLVR